MKNYTPISCGLIISNEILRLNYLIPLIKPYFDEIVLVIQEEKSDRYSDLGCKEIFTKKMGYSECSRGLLLENMKNEWCFNLDADEIPTYEMCQFILSFEPSDVDVYKTDCYCGKNFGSVDKTVLFRKSKIKWMNALHSSYDGGKYSKKKHLFDEAGSIHLKTNKETIADNCDRLSIDYNIPLHPAFDNAHRADYLLRTNTHEVLPPYKPCGIKSLSKFERKNVIVVGDLSGEYARRIRSVADYCISVDSKFKLAPVWSRGVTYYYPGKGLIDVGFNFDIAVFVGEKQEITPFAKEEVFYE